MQLAAIIRIIGLLLMIFSFAMLPPALVGVIYGDGEILSFILAFAVTLSIGVVLWLPVRNKRNDLRVRDGFLVVVVFWLVLGATGALPLYFSERPFISLTDAVFESISALTTTGATVLTGIDKLPHSILFYRQQLQWMGGMGIIVLAVAILPMLGIGGMQLYRAETPGPMKDNKLTPRITETAKALWFIYLGLTILCAVSYSLHFLSWRTLTIRPYLQDPEVQTYFVVLTAAAAITTIYLYFSGTFENPGSAIHHGIFQAVSIGTTSGFTTAEYYAWPGFLPVMLLFTSFIGGCAGSTGGGLKVIRFLLLFRQGIREIKRLVHPNALIPVKIGNKPLPERVINAVWGFFSLYVASFAILMLMVMATGMDQVTSFSAVAACMNNLGPGLGDVGAHYGDINEVSKWVLCFAMLLGRLEIFTLLVLFSSEFWRK